MRPGYIGMGKNPLAMMTEFYGRLRAGEGRANALRNARLTMLAKREPRHPYYWAPFILMGNWL